MTESQKLMRMLAGVLQERGYAVVWKDCLRDAGNPRLSGRRVVVSIAEGGTRVELMSKVLGDGEA